MHLQHCGLVGSYPGRHRATFGPGIDPPLPRRAKGAHVTAEQLYDHRLTGREPGEAAELSSTDASQDGRANPEAEAAPAAVAVNCRSNGESDQDRGANARDQADAQNCSAAEGVHRRLAYLFVHRRSGAPRCHLCPLCWLTHSIVMSV